MARRRFGPVEGVKRHPWIILLLVVGVAAAAVIAVATNNPTAGVALYAVTVSTTVLLMNVAAAATDEPDLRISVSRQAYYSEDQVMIYLRLVNVGRRPIRIEQAGLWHVKDPTAPHTPMWNTWERADKGMPSPPAFPVDLEESKSSERWAWPGSIARYYVRHPVSRWLFVDDSKGDRTWLELKPAVVKLLDQAWPVARAQYEKEQAEKQAKEAPERPASPATDDEFEQSTT